MKERSTGNTVLIVDGGGRGAALADKYAQSDHVGKIVGVPGAELWGINTDKEVKIYPDIKTVDKKSIGEICEQEKVNLVDVAQDRAVEVGLVNLLIEKGIPVIGPTREAGRIEWDKAWAREFGFFKLHIPQPDFIIRTREQLDSALTLMDLEESKPRFIKAAFLAEGKGAKPAKTREEAKEEILEISKTDEGRVFLIEDWLKGDDGSQGEEFSLFVASDGEHYRVLGNAQDYKRENNFDEGENTGSMGCNSPTLLLTPELLCDTKKRIIEKTIFGLKEKGIPYKGVLYLGGMAINKKRGWNNFGDIYEQKPYVIEFNARWGDPEAQAIIPGLKVDFFELGKAISDGNISKINIKRDGKTRVAVTCAAKGYPRKNEYKFTKGKRIFGLEEVMRMSGIKIYTAAIREINKKYYAWGGRLFYIVGEGENIIEAKRKVALAMATVYIEDDSLKTRSDIGWRDVERLCNPPRKITGSITEELEKGLRAEGKNIKAIIKERAENN